MSRQQARRPDNRMRAVAIALLLVLAAGLAFTATYIFAPQVATESPASTQAAATETPAPAMTAGDTGTPGTSAAPSATPSAGATSTRTGTMPPSPTPVASARPTVVPTRTPSPAPTATPSPTKTPPPTASPAPPGGRSAYVTNGSRSGSRIALTFDFGGRIGDAQAIVEYLIARNVHATIFITGKQIDTTEEGPAVLERICPLGSQFALGNHSYNHPDFDSIPPSQMQTELSTTEAAFARYCSRSPRPFFRPPSGAMGGYGSTKYYQILDTVGAAGYSRTVAWDVDTLDWGAPGTSYYRTTAQIVTKVETNATAGSIVLMHLGGYNTYAAIQQLVPWLRGQGYELVTLHEMLGV